MQCVFVRFQWFFSRKMASYWDVLLVRPPITPWWFLTPRINGEVHKFGTPGCWHRFPVIAWRIIQAYLGLFAMARFSHQISWCLSPLEETHGELSDLILLLFYFTTVFKGKILDILDRNSPPMLIAKFLRPKIFSKSFCGFVSLSCSLTSII